MIVRTKSRALMAGLTHRGTMEPKQSSYNFYDAPLAAVDSWSGKAVGDLPLNTLMDYPEMASSDHLRGTVPEAFRGEATGPALPVSETNSLEKVRESFEVLAVDVAGNALTRTTFTNTYTDADGWSYAIMPKEQAFAQLEAFRALPAGDRLVEAEAGRTYNGPILRVTDDHVYQHVGTQIVEHERSKLVGGKLDSHESGVNRPPVKIRYALGDTAVVIPEREKTKGNELSKREPLVAAKQIGGIGR